MIAKGTEDYKKAQEMAKKIMMWSNVKRSERTAFETGFEYIGRLLFKVKENGGFAAQVAETIDKTMNPYGYMLVKISDKQAWIIACSLIENGYNE